MFLCFWDHLPFHCILFHVPVSRKYSGLSNALSLIHYFPFFLLSSTLNLRFLCSCVRPVIFASFTLDCLHSGLSNVQWRGLNIKTSLIKHLPFLLYSFVVNSSFPVFLKPSYVSFTSLSLHCQKESYWWGGLNTISSLTQHLPFFLHSSLLILRFLYSCLHLSFYSLPIHFTVYWKHSGVSDVWWGKLKIPYRP